VPPNALCVATLAAVAGPRVPVAARIALRDLVRYRVRSGAALAAVSFVVFLAVLIAVIASVRFSNVLDWTGPNLTSSQLIVFNPDRGPNQGGPGAAPPTQAELNVVKSRTDTLAAQLHAPSVLALYSASSSASGPAATLVQAGRRNNNYSGPLYVATPALLREYGIKASQIAPDTDIAPSPRRAPAPPPAARSPASPPPHSACSARCSAPPSPAPPRSPGRQQPEHHVR
jgi:putative ABC transport system permease protein